MGETRAMSTPAWQMVDFWDGTLCSELNHNLVVKLNTSCVQNVVATERGGLGRARPGTDAEDSFFPGAGHTYPHLDEIHVRDLLSFGDRNPRNRRHVFKRQAKSGVRRRI
jgi:hypothetical protein